MRYPVLYTLGIFGILFLGVNESCLGQGKWTPPYSSSAIEQSSSFRSSAIQDETWLERQHFNWIGGAWEQDAQYTVQRNGFQQETQSLYQTGVVGNLQNGTLTTRTYPTPGEPWTESIVQSWDGNQWVEDQRCTRAYTPQGDLSARTIFHWNGTGWDTTEADLFTLVYNANNQVTSTEKASWRLSTQSFENINRERFSYNANQEVDTFWVDVFASNSWVPDLRFVDFSWFDFTNEQPGGYIRQTFGNGFYAPTLRVSFSYGTNGSYEQTNLSWNGTVWSIEEREDHTFDSQGRKILYESFDLVNTDYVFDQGFQWEYSYSTSNELLECIFRTSDNDSLYLNQERDLYNGYTVNTFEPDSWSRHISISPNPFQEFLVIETAFDKPQATVFQLFDAQGRILRQLTIPASQTRLRAEFPELEKGIYFYQIKGRSHVASGTLVHF